MNKYIITKINWYNIIFNTEFIQYFDLELLKEISLLSRLAREILKPSIFNSIQLSVNDFDFNLRFNLNNLNNVNNGNIFIEYFNDLISCDVDRYITNSKKKEFRKSLSIESGLKDITDPLKKIKIFTKNFTLSEVERAGYYLFPIINIFSNLTSLKLLSCVIPFTGFSKLGESMPCLKCIELSFVILAKSQGRFTSPNDFIFPKDLNNLKIYYCRLTNTKLLSNPYKFLFDKSAQITYNNFTLPKISVPSLKKLVFLHSNSQDNGLRGFLDINTDLEFLRIATFDSSVLKRLNNLKSLEVDKINTIANGVQLCTLKNITKIKINHVGIDNYINIKKLCLLCPNLSILHLNINPYESFHSKIDSFLTSTLSNLPKLITLQLCVIINENIYFNITKLNNIKNLILRTNRSTILNFNLENFGNLKKVKLCSYMNEINTNEFKDKFNNYRNWVFKFSDKSIRGYRLSKQNNC